jgi:hypothetical protein
VCGMSSFVAEMLELIDPKTNSIIVLISFCVPIPVTALYKLRTCGLKLHGITVSNPAGDIDTSRVSIVCCQVEVNAWG